MNDKLFQDIQAYLNAQRETHDEEAEYEKLLEAFNQIPSYVERFTRREEER